MEKVDPPKQIAILVSYYPNYLEKSFLRLKSILDQDAEIVVVNNKLHAVPNILGESFTVVQGSNKYWEFSAWDEGVEYLLCKYTRLDNSTIIFANDTFFYHRIFLFLDLFLFRKGIEKVSSRQFDFSGELNELISAFTVNSEETNGWISTYLFAIHGSVLFGVLPFSKIDKVYLKIENEKIYLDNCSSEFLNHLSQWIFPKYKRLGWSGNNQDISENGHVYKKIIAIMNEKLLFVFANKNQFKIYNVYEGRLSSFYLLLRKAVYKFIFSQAPKAKS